MATDTKPAATAAPPQTPAAAQQRALQVAEETKAVEVAQNMAVTAMLGRPDKSLERIETTVTIPIEYQYDVTSRKNLKPKGSNQPDNWVTIHKVGLTIDGYDYLNRVMAVSFFLTPRVPSRDGELRHNPIIEKDYIRLRMGAVWYTPLGQSVMAIEDVEVDFGLIYQDKKANAFSAKIRRDPETNDAMWDLAGNPVIDVSDDDLLKVVRELTRMRAFGPRYAITIGRVRLLKQASGIRSLPLSDTGPRAFIVRVVGYRDQMTAYQRIEAAGGDLKALYGSDSGELRDPDKDPSLKPLDGKEAQEVGGSDTIIDAETEVGTEAAAADTSEAKADAPVAAAEAVGEAPDQGVVRPFTADEIADVDDLIEGKAVDLQPDTEPDGLGLG